MSDATVIEEHDEHFLKACTAITKLKGWSWQKGMRILSGWVLLPPGGVKTHCGDLNVDEVLLGRPFSDKTMQTVKDAIPNLRDEKTIEVCLEALRDLWKHPGVRIVESGDGWSLFTRLGQHWSKHKWEVILMGYETISWNDRDGGRWA
jgi:hypothetical protein